MVDSLAIIDGGPHCVTCPHQHIGKRLIRPDGQGTNGILILGESGWLEEARLGRPFAGAAGAQLDKWFRKLGLSRDAFLISNAMWCLPPRLGWFQSRDASEAINHCRPYLDELIAKAKPKVILTLGPTALRRVTGLAAPLEKLHSYVLDSPYGIPVVATYHPSYIMQGNQKLTPSVLFAMRRALEIAKQNGQYQRSPVRYLLDPSIDEAKAYFDEWSPDEAMANDIETPHSGKLDEEQLEEEDDSYSIVRVSFSHTPSTGITFPWTEPYISLAKDVLSRARLLVYWNHNYDVPRLKANGCEIAGEIHDAMWGWHFLQSDMLKSLGFVAPFYSDLPAWKHLSDAQPAFYSAVDADATIRCYQGIKAELEKQGRWPRFVSHCVKALPILHDMGKAGLLVDLARQSAFKDRLDQEWADANEKLQTLVPDQLRVAHPKLGYKRTPKDVTGLVQRKFIDEAGEVERWCRLTPFNPDSPNQVADLIKHYGLAMPKNRKTGNDSTAAKYLGRFAKKQDVFKWILECRERSTMISTFIWPTNKEQRVQTTYGFHPSTFRKSSRAVNLQNIPKRNELAKEFRKMLIAAPGHVLIEADSSAIEAVLVGYWAGDPDYIRLAKAGVHDFLTAHLMGKPISKDTPLAELVPYLKAIKREHPHERESAKRCIHGGNYKLTAYGLNDEYPEFFPTQRKAQEMLDFYFGLFPSIPKWHLRMLDRAHKESFIDNHFNYRHYFYDVFTWDNGSWRLGNDAKRVIAFGPQSDASAIQTEILLKLADDELVRSLLRLIIHDSVILEVPLALVDEVATRVYEAFTMPFAELGGLSIGAEIGIGPNLGEMKAWQPLPIMPAKTLDINGKVCQYA